MNLRPLESFFDLKKGDIIIAGSRYITYVTSDLYKDFPEKCYRYDIKIMLSADKPYDTTITIGKDNLSSFKLLPVDKNEREQILLMLMLEL